MGKVILNDNGYPEYRTLGQILAGGVSIGVLATAIEDGGIYLWDRYDRFEEVRRLYETADAVFGFSITDLCFNGPEEELRQTYNTQPALLLTCYAAWQVLKSETQLRPHLFAGHSLGEYTAMLASGFFAFEDALRITRKRAQKQTKSRTLRQKKRSHKRSSL